MRPCRPPPARVLVVAGVLALAFGALAAEPGEEDTGPVPVPRSIPVPAIRTTEGAAPLADWAGTRPGVELGGSGVIRLAPRAPRHGGDPVTRVAIPGSPVPSSAAVADTPPPWPRPLPPDPAGWFRQNGERCGLTLQSVRTEARSTAFPLPSGGAIVLWEVGIHATGTGVLADVRQLLRALHTASCGVHIPDLVLTWEQERRLGFRMEAVLMGTWTQAPARPPARSVRR